MRLHVDLKRRGVGDTVNASGLLRDLFRADPDVRVSVSGNRADDVFKYDPCYAGSDPAGADRVVTIDYKPTRDAYTYGNRRARYAFAAHDDYERVTGARIERGPPRPHLFLGGDEFERPHPERYAVIAAGSKQDIPVKQWPLAHFAEVVARTPHVKWKQVGMVHDGRLAHRQRHVPGTEDLIGRTSIRGLFRLIAHADLVLCHVSLPMMIASAFGVRCIAVLGGREDPELFDDLGVTVLHTIGELDCCAERGCYAAAALPGRRPEEFPPGWLCRRPLELAGERPAGECMARISPAHVADLVRAAIP